MWCAIELFFLFIFKTKIDSLKSVYSVLNISLDNNLENLCAQKITHVIRLTREEEHGWREERLNCEINSARKQLMQKDLPYCFHKRIPNIVNHLDIHAFARSNEQFTAAICVLHSEESTLSLFYTFIVYRMIYVWCKKN